MCHLDLSAAFCSRNNLSSTLKLVLFVERRRKKFLGCNSLAAAKSPGRTFIQNLNKLYCLDRLSSGDLLNIVLNNAALHPIVYGSCAMVTFSQKALGPTYITFLHLHKRSLLFFCVKLESCLQLELGKMFATEDL